MFNLLSAREKEVVEKIISGVSNQQAGKELFVTEKTIKFHLTNIFKKLNVKSRAGLIVYMASLRGKEDEVTVMSYHDGQKQIHKLLVRVEAIKEAMKAFSPAGCPVVLNQNALSVPIGKGLPMGSPGNA